MDSFPSAMIPSAVDLLLLKPPDRAGVWGKGKCGGLAQGSRHRLELPQDPTDPETGETRDGQH